MKVKSIISIIKSIFVKARKVTEEVTVLKEVVKGERFIYNMKVYVKHVYDRSTKQYICVNILTNEPALLSGSTLVLPIKKAAL